jgi:histidine ammonia-lyase
MAPNAARHAWEIIWNVERIVAIEMLCAAQGIDFRLAGRAYIPQQVEGDRVRYITADVPPLRLGAGTSVAYQRIRGIVPALVVDRPLTPDIEAVAALVRSGDLVNGR